MPQENGLLEMEGSVENIVYHNDSNQYTVLEVDCGEELITVVGTFPYVSVGERLHLYGTWTSHATFGQQFRAQAFGALPSGGHGGDAEIPFERRGEGHRRRAGGANYRSVRR